MRIKCMVPRLWLVCATLAGAGCASQPTTQDVGISTNPPGAHVVIDRQAIGATPGTATLTRNSSHLVELSKDGYQSQRVELNPEKGANGKLSLVPANLNVALQPVAAETAAAPAAQALPPAAEAPAAEAAMLSTPIPPPGALDKSKPPSTLRKSPAEVLIMGGLHVHMGRTTLAEVQSAVGAGQMLQQGHDDSYRAWLCYTITGSAGDPPQRIWLVSSALNGGTRVDGVDAARLPQAFGASASCPELPAQLSTVRFSNGVWLGATQSDLLQNYGKPGARGGQAWSYSFTETGTNFEVLQMLQAQMINGTVVALHIGRQLKI